MSVAGKQGEGRRVRSRNMEPEKPESPTETSVTDRTDPWVLKELTHYRYTGELSRTTDMTRDQQRATDSVMFWTLSADQQQQTPGPGVPSDEWTCRTGAPRAAGSDWTGSTGTGATSAGITCTTPRGRRWCTSWLEWAWSTTPGSTARGFTWDTTMTSSGESPAPAALHLDKTNVEPSDQYWSLLTTTSMFSNHNQVPLVSNVLHVNGFQLVTKRAENVQNRFQ